MVAVIGESRCGRGKNACGTGKNRCSAIAITQIELNFAVALPVRGCQSSKQVRFVVASTWRQAAFHQCNLFVTCPHHSSSTFSSIAGMAPHYVPMPDLCCDTTWYSAQTRTLVYQALRAGFRGIDTAAQPSQYREDLVGDGMRDAIQAGILRRKDLHVSVLP